MIFKGPPEKHGENDCRIIMLRGIDLSESFKIKLKSADIRVVYKLIRTETEMLVVVIGARADEEVYETAQNRAQKNNL